jgi:hypothetical protein
MRKELNYGDSYELNQKEQQIIIDMASRIGNQDRSYFENNFKRDKTMDLGTMNLNGFGAELAFCILTNSEFDSTTNPDENHFLKDDAVLADGRTVDVKTTKYKTGKLIIRCGKEEKKVDLYALMIGEFPKFTFRGWISYNDIIQDENITQLPQGKSYVKTQSELNHYLKIQ